nr:MAG TPA: hypothetical protein [Caudoviricetes sp.]
MSICCVSAPRSRSSCRWSSTRRRSICTASYADRRRPESQSVLSC